MYKFLLLFVVGCSPTLTPELIEALSKDKASFCASIVGSGGAGGMTISPVPVIPVAGYGYGRITFCRSNHEKAKLSINPEGVVSIEHAD